MSIESLIRQDLQDFTAYSSARLETIEGRVWLNANESPWNHDGEINRYPQQQPEAFLRALAAYYRIETNQVLATRGSDEGIDLLMRLFCQAGKDSILICPPTFGMYEVSAKLQGANVIKVPLLKPDFALDVETILKSCQPRIKLIFLCSPNNPTGNLMEVSQVLRLAEKLSGKALIVIDEAYIEFSDCASMAQYINQYDNLVVLRTFSKALGLAAARVGALLAAPCLIKWLKKILPPYPLPQLSIDAAMKVLASLDTIYHQITLVSKERERILNALRPMTIVENVWPSAANFVFVQFKQPVMNSCAEQGIVLRDMAARTGINHAVRITLGTPQENKLLLNVLSHDLL